MSSQFSNGCLVDEVNTKQLRLQRNAFLPAAVRSRVVHVCV